MATSPMPFKKGDRVRVVSGSSEGETGFVVQVDSIPIADTLFEMVWVQLEKEIEGFLPQNLERIERQ